jgi:glutamate racemase
VQLIDSAEETAAAVAAGLGKDGLEAGNGTPPTHRYVVSDDPDRFRRVGTGFLGDRIGTVEVTTFGTE